MAVPVQDFVARAVGTLGSGAADAVGTIAAGVRQAASQGGITDVSDFDNLQVSEPGETAIHSFTVLGDFPDPAAYLRLLPSETKEPATADEIALDDVAACLANSEFDFMEGLSSFSELGIVNSIFDRKGPFASDRDFVSRQDAQQAAHSLKELEAVVNEKLDLNRFIGIRGMLGRPA